MQPIATRCQAEEIVIAENRRGGRAVAGSGRKRSGRMAAGWDTHRSGRVRQYKCTLCVQSGNKRFKCLTASTLSPIRSGSPLPPEMAKPSPQLPQPFAAKWFEYLIRGKAHFCFPASVNSLRRPNLAAYSARGHSARSPFPIACFTDRLCRSSELSNDQKSHRSRRR
jgi:hypothetical protein